MTRSIKAQSRPWAPYVVGAVFVALFAALGVWQISRGLEKKARQEAFEAQSGFASWFAGMEVQPFQSLKVTGRFVADRQLLLENIIVNSRVGYYVVTPLRIADDEPLLLVNRGWLAEIEPGTLDLGDARITVRGRAGALPRAGYRMGDAIPAGQGWPKRAVYPTLQEVAGELGAPVLPFVLLMDPEDDAGFYREWTPEVIGPGRHFGYALQWFAMGAVLAGLLAWNFRKRGFES